MLRFKIKIVAIRGQRQLSRSCDWRALWERSVRLANNHASVEGDESYDMREARKRSKRMREHELVK